MLPNQAIAFAKTQWLLELFIFFSIVPLIKIAGISITFYIFLAIIFVFLRKKIQLFKMTSYGEIFLLLFLFFVILSGVFAEDDFFRQRGQFSIIKLMIQYAYWVFVALIIKTWIYEYDFIRISRMFFISTVVAIVYFNTLNHIYLVYFPNAFAYIVVTVLPLGFYYAVNRFAFPIAILIAFVVLMGVMTSGSRTGTALVLLELIFMLSLGRKSIRVIVVGLFLMTLPLFLTLALTLSDADIRDGKLAIADSIEDVSPKIAHTLRMKKNVFERDKSWLMRVLMWQKGEKIFEEHPFFGIGPGNFTYFYVDLDIGSVSKWLHATETKYNRTSSQNSFLLILTENGILALFCLVMVFLIILLRGGDSVIRGKTGIRIFIYIPFVFLLAYSWILVTTMGTLFWLYLGFALTLLNRKKELA